MNNVSLIGRLVKDSELFDIGKGDKKTQKMTFTIAVDDGFGDNKQTYFIQCELWGKRAESLFDYMLKGVQVGIEGKLVTGNYENKDGKKIYFTTVNIREITLLSKPKDKDEDIQGNREEQQSINRRERK